MQNTDYHPCSEKPEQESRSRTVSLFGTEFSVRNYICSQDGIHYPPMPEKWKVELSVCITSWCPAACPFCVAGNTAQKQFLNPEKLRIVLEELAKEGMVRGVSITGGEPFADTVLLNEVISMIFEILGEHTELSVTTNGMAIEDLLRIQKLSYLDALHISRHHFLDEKNEEIFGIPVAGREQLKEVVSALPYPDLFVLNCMLLKGYIENTEDVCRYLDHALDIGIPKSSFITAIPSNDYTRRSRLAYEAVIPREDPRFLFTRGYRDYEYCRCQDACYVSKDGRWMHLYGRATDSGSCPYARGLVYTADNCLKTGYAGAILFQP